jgi:chemotaxis protein methyltransferase CheR
MAVSVPEQDANEKVEISRLLEEIFAKYGYDFRQYSVAHIRRRIRRRMELEGLDCVSDLQQRLLADEKFFQVVFNDLSINVTEMFRDPSFYLAVRENVVPLLATYPFIKVWHAGCATGEELYSMAILLQEEGLYSRLQLYGTDFNEYVLQKAREGIVSAKSLKEYTLNYQRSGGVQSFADYYTARYDRALLAPGLKDKVLFANHNLVTDHSFGEMQMVVCRNVLIYFSRELQRKVIRLFHDSLCRGGVLCLGSKESLRFSGLAAHFEQLVPKERIYIKKYASH